MITDKTLDGKILKEGNLRIGEGEEGMRMFDEFKNKNEIKKLANKHNFFISQANIMPKVATTFGRYLGPRGKMPNPKVGAVLPPNANVKSLYEKLCRTVNVATRNESTIKCIVGKEDTDDEQVIDNILTVYNSILQKLPNDKQNVKNVSLKLTMGPAFKVGEEVKTSNQKTKEIPKKDTESKPTETKKETKAKEK